MKPSELVTTLAWLPITGGMVYGLRRLGLAWGWALIGGVPLGFLCVALLALALSLVIDRRR